MSDVDLIRARTHAEYQLAYARAERDEARAYANALWGALEHIIHLRYMWRKEGRHDLADQIRTVLTNAGFKLIDRDMDVLVSHRSIFPLAIDTYEGPPSDQARAVPDGQRIDQPS